MHSAARDFTLNLTEEHFPLAFFFIFHFWTFLCFGGGEGGNYLMARTWATSPGGNHAQQLESVVLGRLREIFI